MTKFPEFLLQVLPYIADRTVWIAIASSYKMIHEKSKEDACLPPWPMNFHLCVPGYNPIKLRNPVWSPDGTQIACITNRYGDDHRIVIFDQRRGLLRFRRPHGDDDNNNNKIGWFAHARYSNTLFHRTEIV
ncbi:MAG: hypothetical protein ACI8RD_014898 [Bacillariaceae sp.]